MSMLPMKKFITAFNALGVIALVGVSVFQWRESSGLRHRRDELDRSVAELGKKLTTTEAALTAATATIEEFRKRIEVLDADNARLVKSLRESETRVATLTADVARLEKTVGAWKDAVAERDKAIVALNASLKEQVDARNDATTRYNDLVSKYNDLAKRTAESEKLVLAARAERDKAVAELKAAIAVNNS
jgi:chromosome segregation ATPase